MEERRLNKAIADSGFCSRREADKVIEAGRVTVNGEKAGLGVKVTEQDRIQVDGKDIIKNENLVYLIFHKPTGITCTTDLRVKGNIISHLNYPERIFPIGRLDKPSEGLIFLTNDGNIVNKILRSRNNHEKEYIVWVDRKIGQQFIRRMSNGIPILETVTKKCKVEKIDDYSFRIVLTQGLNRQIRRMCEYLGYEVTRLKRVRIMNVKLGNLKYGGLRPFTKKELNQLLALTDNSEKTHFID